MEVTGRELVVWNRDQAQILKGKRTKRSRLPSPPRLCMASSSCSSAGRTSTDDNSGGSSIVDMATTSTDQLRSSTEEEDMANCLILLAQGHTREPSSHNNNNNNNSDKASSGLYLYQCKTCDRCFPSFRALGGHRASHKKPKPNNSEEKLQPVTLANEEGDPYDPTASFVLSLQISNRASYSSSSNTNKSKVHECSICGAAFTSGQALGGHMRRHRTLVNTSATCTTSTGNNSELQQANKPKNVLKLDLNLPAPEDDHRESKLPFQSRENALVFSASSLVDCHY